MQISSLKKSSHNTPVSGEIKHYSNKSVQLNNKNNQEQDSYIYH